MSSRGVIPPQPPNSLSDSSDSRAPMPHIEPAGVDRFGPSGAAGDAGPSPAWGPGYQPGYGIRPRRNNGLSIASMVTGIVSIVFCWFGALLAIVAIVLGVVGLNQIKNDATQQGRGFAIAGIACGVFAFVLQAVLIAMWIGLFVLTRQIESPPPG